jgi:hypothetical protein
LSMWWFSRRSSISVTMRDMVSSISGGGDRCSSALDRTRFEVCLYFFAVSFFKFLFPLWTFSTHS